MKYHCKPCNYSTNNKTNFSKHLATQKCVATCAKNQLSYDNNLGKNNRTDENIERHVDGKKNGKYECKFCQKTFSCAPNLSRHQNHYCKFKDCEKMQDEKSKPENNEKMEIPENGNITKMFEKIVQQNNEFQKDIVAKFEQLFKDGGQAILNNNKKLAKTTQRVEKATELSYKTIDNFKFIMQHFQDAPNFSFVNNAKEILVENMKKYMECGKPMKALTHAFLSIIIHKDVKKRSIHGVDQSRVKYMIKRNDIWKSGNIDEIMDQFLVMFEEAADLYMIDNITSMTDSGVTKTENMMKFLKMKTTPGKIAKKTYPQVKLDQIAYLKNLANIKNMAKRK